MLVLSRQARERVIIGDYEVIVEVIKIDRGKVRLGFECNKTVHREEIYERIKREERNNGNS